MSEEYLDCDAEILKNNQSREEACKSRIWNRLNNQKNIPFDDPEYKRLRDFFFGDAP